jgi:hypothetical protein
MKVFLSSTAQDLVQYRQVADDTILRLSHRSIVMERFGPLAGEPAIECERKARDSDVVICIVAHRYGFVPESGKGSITRREVEAGWKAGKHVLVWLVDDGHPWSEKKEQDLLTDPAVLADQARITEVISNIAELTRFKAWLRHTFVCDTFTTPDDLGRRIAVALSSHAHQFSNSRTELRRQGEIRIVHALQPAPYFFGRDPLVTDLSTWVADLASPDRVWSLVAAGGTGKTAIVERVVREIRPSEANVLVWSFYERPDANAFLSECYDLFFGQEATVGDGSLERLERGLRGGQPHLLVLDGLERVQADVGQGRLRGELLDQTLKQLLRTLAAGLGRARALVTSRFPLVDLHDWHNRGYKDTRLDDLTPEAAEAVLRGWNVIGDTPALRTIAAQVGNHALSVAVLGSYLQSFAGGRAEESTTLRLDDVTGEDPKAAKLARVLAFYADRLPSEERALIARLSVFSRGVTLELLHTLVEAGGEVAGPLAHAKPRLLKLLKSLEVRGLVFEYRADSNSVWTAHPFLREKFKDLLGVASASVFDVVARSLSAGLEGPSTVLPSDFPTLDRYEQLVEATRLAGREQEAFDLYWLRMGGYAHLGCRLAEYLRTYQMLAAFSSTGRPEDLAPKADLRRRAMLANTLALVALRLGRTAEAWRIRQVADEWCRSMGSPALTSIWLQNSSEVAFARGRLAESFKLADLAVLEATAANDDWQRVDAEILRGLAAHCRGHLAAARANSLHVTLPHERWLLPWSGVHHARHQLDLGQLRAAQEICARGLAIRDWPANVTRFHLLLARINLAEGGDPNHYLQQVRDTTSQTGHMQQIIETHLLSARHLLALGDHQSALADAQIGLQQARSCEYLLLRIELLIVLARIWLAWPAPSKAVQAAREALDLASDPDCDYAWGQADAAQVWGEGYYATNEGGLAKGAFARALQVRTRIDHPAAIETRRWLGRVE